MKRFSATLLVAGLLASGAAGAAEYLVVPLIGDRLTVATANVSVGSNIDRNDYQVISLPQLPYYDVMERVIVAEVKKVDKQAVVKPLAFKNGMPGVDLDRETPADVAAKASRALASLVKPGEKQWLVLLLPWRTDPRMRLHSGHVGYGKVGGLGFYIDRTMALQRLDSLESDVGFLGVFANFHVLLVDPATGTIASQQSVQDGWVRSVAGSGKTHPWDVITAEEKSRMVNQLAGTELRRAMPALLAGAGLKAP